MRKLQAAGFAAALALLAGACGSDNNDPAITDEQGAAIGEAIASQLATAPSSFTATDFTATATGGGIFFSRGGLSVRRPAGGPALTLQPPCGVPSDPTDSDQDGVPDDATYTFLAADCSGPGYEVTGSIRIQDVQAAVGYIATYANFKTTFFGQGNEFVSLEFDGSHGVSGSVSLAALAEDLTVTLSANQGGQNFSGTVSNDWSLSFDASNDDLAMDSPLPDGSFDINGSFDYNISGTRAGFDITTVSPLVFDSSCGLDWPFSTGEVRAHLVGEGANVYAKIVYTGCGTAPDVTFFGRNS